MALHLSNAHQLAGVAASHCINHRSPLIGGVACGKCWELAIRDDERFAVENGLPRDLSADIVISRRELVALTHGGER